MFLQSTKLSHANNDTNPSRSATSLRKKLWEVDTQFHCSIIDTCLMDQELKKILSKAQDKIESIDPLSLHGKCVQAVGKKNKASKFMHKFLDRKYQQAIRSFSKAGSEQEVEFMWDRDWETGQFQGAFWAVMTHPQSGDELLMRAFSRQRPS